MATPTMNLVDWKISSNEEVTNIVFLLKRYLRELGNSLLTTTLYTSFIAITDVTTFQRKVEHIKLVTNMLPPTNYELLKTICGFLKKQSARCQTGKPNIIGRLAIIFAPLFLLPSHPSSFLRIADAVSTVEVVGLLISAYDHIFLGDNTRGSPPEEFPKIWEKHYSNVRSMNDESLMNALRLCSTQFNKSEMETRTQFLSKMICQGNSLLDTYLVLHESGVYNLSRERMLGLLKLSARQIRTMTENGDISDYENSYGSHHSTPILTSIPCPTSHREISALIQWKRSSASSSDESCSDPLLSNINTHERSTMGTSSSGDPKKGYDEVLVRDPEFNHVSSAGDEGILDCGTILGIVRRGWMVWLLSLVFLIATTTKEVGMTNWLKRLAPSETNSLSAYVVIFYGSFFLLLVSSVGAAACWLGKGKPRPPKFYSNSKWYLSCGTFLSLGTVLFVMTGATQKTPAPVQVVVSNSRIAWSVLISLFLFSRQDRSYTVVHWFGLLSLLFVVIGIVLLLIPVIQLSKGSSGITEDVILGFTYLLGNISLSMFPLLVERSYLHRKKFIPGTSGTFNIFLFTFWISFVQFIIVVCLFWLDILPILGSIPNWNINSFFRTFAAESTCLFQVNSCPDSVWMGFIFVLAWWIQILMVVKLSHESSNYVQILVTASTCLNYLFWMTFPNFLADVPPVQTLWASLPLWSVLPSLFLFLLGSVIWKISELREKNLVTPKLAY
eukprot:TRINITY_DN10256_c0_g1_i6.p1 TRINITY_DN10256_c0_g1~~TRINITY_DN10256_c0_g1_i6.p1  ORF type:complete len:727 (+),score=112.41 TRINITY_DN10256_c0_g1_i6:393-2573(+)